MTVHERPFGRYFEDFELGDVYKHWPGKTITEYDDHLFCMITMNHHPLHTDAWYAETQTQFGKNVVVGNLVYSLVLGMSVPDVSGVAIANLEVETLQHKKPTFHGDTIYAETKVLDKKESQSKPDRGVVTRRDPRLQPARRRGLLLPPAGDGAQAGRGPAPATPVRLARVGPRISRTESTVSVPSDRISDRGVAMSNVPPPPPPPPVRPVSAASSTSAPPSATRWKKFQQNAGPLILIVLIIVRREPDRRRSCASRSTRSSSALVLVGAVLDRRPDRDDRYHQRVADGDARRDAGTRQGVHAPSTSGRSSSARSSTASSCCIGLILCIIPGIIAAFMLSFYGFYILDQRHERRPTR